MRLLVFDLREIVGGWIHLFKGFMRRSCRRPVDFYLTDARYKELDATAVQADGRMQTCFICGYALASVKLASGWVLQTCSATGLNALNSDGFAQWQSQLSSAQALVNSAEPTKGS